MSEAVEGAKPSRHRAQSSKRKRRLAVAGLLVAGLAAGASMLSSRLWSRHRPTPPAVQTVTAGPTVPDDLVLADETQRAQISTEPVSLQTVTVDRDTTGKVGFNEEKQTPVFTPYAGRAVEVLVNKGQVVRAGQPLAVIESAELVAAENDLAAARADVDKADIGAQIARTALERARHLHSQEAISTRELQLAEGDQLRADQEVIRARAALSVVEGRLSLFGKSRDEIARLGGRIDNRVVLRAPIGGTVVDRKVGLGQYVKPDSPDPLFLLADLSRLWVQADVYESDVSRIRVGDPVRISMPTFPGRDFSARISYISPTEDTTTHTVRVRCVVQNESGLLKPEMFAKIKIAATQEQLAVVPASAVITQKDKVLVLVEEGPGRYRKRDVQVGQEKKGVVTLSSGVRPGERVVTRGALLINESKQSG